MSIHFGDEMAHGLSESPFEEAIVAARDDVMAFFKPNNYRKAGDAARDQRDFAAAESNYRNHLATNQEDAPIWVQLGHAVKEQRGPKAAIEFYERATQADPASADAFTHLAHALKNDGDFDRAVTAFEAAHALSPNNDFLRELTLLGVEISPADRGPSVFLSVQDLIGYLQAHQTLSGIQRVQAGIAMHAIDAQTENIRFIRTDTESKLPAGSFWEIDRDSLKNVIRYAIGSSVSHDRLKNLLHKCHDNVAPVAPSDGDTIILLGAFWGYGNTANYYAPAKAAGAKIAAYIYDLIPITHPEYCDEKLAVDFALSLTEICHIADYFLTISEFTAQELGKFLRKHSFNGIPVGAVPLAHTLSDKSRRVAKWPKSLAELERVPYALYVSTVEGRKNHQYVVKAWQRLIDEGVEVPHLVFVGRMGWRIGGLKELLKSTENLGGRVHIVHDLTDAELASLYDGALFTTFTSFVEGWGLPVGESLIHGKPCIASGSSSIPEVGGDFVDYVNPNDIDSGVTAFRRMIVDDAYRADRTKSVRERFVPRTWSDVAKDFFAKAESLATASKPIEYTAIEVPSGILVRPGDATGTINLAKYRRVPSRLLFSPDFFNPEHWGCWMKGAYGSVRFQTGLAEKFVYIYLKVAMTEGASKADVAVYQGGLRAISVNFGDLRQTNIIRVRARTSAEGICAISIKVEGKYEKPSEDNRDFALGLIAFGYAAVDDVVGRVELSEALHMHVSG